MTVIFSNTPQVVRHVLQIMEIGRHGQPLASSQMNEHDLSHDINFVAQVEFPRPVSNSTQGHFHDINFGAGANSTQSHFHDIDIGALVKFPRPEANSTQGHQLWCSSRVCSS